MPVDLLTNSDQTPNLGLQVILLAQRHMPWDACLKFIITNKVYRSTKK